jgi:positive regulator of sigma E activity
MKPTVPEAGRVIRTEGENAIIMLDGNRSCRGCGAAKIGLCRAGSVSSMFLTVRNTPGAEQGDQVIIGIDRKTQWSGYILAYLIPLAAFILGAAAGSIIGRHLSVPFLDALSAFGLLGAASAFSFSKLRRLDRTRMMEVRRVVSDGVFKEFCETEEERLYTRSAGS